MLLLCLKLPRDSHPAQSRSQSFENAFLACSRCLCALGFHLLALTSLFTPYPTPCSSVCVPSTLPPLELCILHFLTPRFFTVPVGGSPGNSWCTGKRTRISVGGVAGGPHGLCSHRGLEAASLALGVCVFSSLASG